MTVARPYLPLCNTILEVTKLFSRDAAADEAHKSPGKLLSSFGDWGISHYVPRTWDGWMASMRPFLQLMARVVEWARC